MKKHVKSVVGILCSLFVLIFATHVLRAEPPAAADAKPQWVALWQDAFKNVGSHFDPETPAIVAFCDRTTGDAYLCGWNMGVWKSSDGGKQFVRIDGGKITGPACGPIMPYSAFVSPEGKKIAIFNMWNKQDPSGFSLDGGATWEQFTNVGRDWDFGAMDWDSKTVFGARHEFDTLHVSTDDGKTWTKLDRSRVDPMVTGLGVIDAKTLLLATDRTIERSEDGGKTWNVVSDFGAIGPAKKFNGKLWWLTDHSTLITSSDEGKTWVVKGEIKDTASPEHQVLREPFCGPMFGKDENDIVVACNAGFYETTDGCKTWKRAAPIPDGYEIKKGGCSAAFDPVHNVLYLTNFTHPVMKFVRDAAPEYVVPKIPAAEAGGAGPKADFVELFAPKSLRVLNIVGADMNAGFLYVCTEDGLIWMKPDAETGHLSLAGRSPEPRSNGYNLKCAGGRLYGVTRHNGYHRMSWHGLAWFDLDPRTGTPKRVDIAECPASHQMLVGPDQHDLYFKACLADEGKLLWYHIAADGKPVKSGDVSGNGLGASANDDVPSIMRMTPDGKFIYVISSKDYAIACIARKLTGEISYVNNTSLGSVTKPEPDNYNHQWVSINISPDGQWLYANVRNGKPTENFYGIFKRDPQTGALTLEEAHDGQQDALANLKAWEMCFDPVGDRGYLGSSIGPLITFKYDAKTGRLSDAVAVEATDRIGSASIVFDRADGLLFTGGEYNGVIPRGVCVLKVSSK